VLNQVSLWWFGKTAHIVPNRLFFSVSVASLLQILSPVLTPVHCLRRNAQCSRLNSSCEGTLDPPCRVHSSQLPNWHYGHFDLDALCQGRTILLWTYIVRWHDEAPEASFCARNSNDKGECLGQSFQVCDFRRKRRGMICSLAEPK
jgi:hypothetical protein